MGVVKGISIDEFPKQSNWLGRNVTVCFNYDTSRTIKGTIIRDDAEEPNVMIIQLENGRIVLATECMYQ
jgi:hypothetical protein